MRYSSTPSSFPVAFWKELWVNNINDLEDLRAVASTRGVVAIDIDPYVSDGKTTHHGITEFGISYLPPNGYTPPLPVPSPASLDALIQQFGIQSHSIRVADRHRSELRREPYHFGSGKCQVVDANQVEDVALAIIKSFSGNSDSRPVLVAFSTAYEFSVLTKLYPRLLATKCFSAWADVQEVTLDNAKIIHKRPVVPRSNKSAYLPSMRDTLFALGYCRDGIAITSLKDKHSAGNDAIRVLAVLLGLFALPRPASPAHSPELIISRIGRTQRVDCGDGVVTRKYWRERPDPPELFPYMAMIESTGTPLPKKLTPRVLYAHFVDFEPLAASVFSEPDGGDRCGCLCFPTAEALQHFVEEVHDCASEEFRGVIWWVTPRQTERSNPLETAADFITRMKAREFSAEAQAKRLRRKQKRAELTDR